MTAIPESLPPRADPPPARDGRPAPATGDPLARRMRRVTDSAIMRLIKTTAAGGYTSFASGLPDPRLYPAALLAEITARVLAEDGQAALQYGAAEGYPPLREWVAARLRRRGLPATPEHVLITHGSQQALDLVARCFLDPGDRVLLESPTYLAAIQVFDSYEADYEVVAADDAGMDVAAAARACAARPPRLIYTLPNFQNPTGVTLAPERRQALAGLAAAHRIPLLEDDAYYDLRYDGPPLPPVSSLAENPWAVYTGTFSKTIAPGLRVGFLYAAPPLVARLAQLKQITDLQAGSLSQRIVFEFCRGGHLDPQIDRLRAVYAGRRDTMLRALDRELAGAAAWTRPGGGMFVFVRLPGDRDADLLLEAALARQVVYVPGNSFHPAGGGRNTLRLNFVSADEAAIERGIALLAGVLREALA